MAEPAKPNPVYDDDSSGKPLTRPDLRAKEGIEQNTTTGTPGGAVSGTPSNGGGAADSTSDSASSIKNREEEPNDNGGDASLYNAQGDSGNSSMARRSSGSTSTSRDAEQSAGNRQAADADGGLYNEDGDQGRFASLRRTQGRARNLRARALRNKLLVGGAMGGGTAVIVLVILFALLIGGYKVVDFAEHVAAYQFARVTAQMAEDTTSIDAEKIGLESIPDTSIGQQLSTALKDKYTSTAFGSGTQDLWSKLDNYRPNKIISNFQNDSTLQFNEGTTRFGTTYIKSITLDGETTELQAKSLSNAFRNKLIPGYQFSNSVSYARDIAPNLNDALDAAEGDIGPITRARVASQIRQELNISLVAWLAGRYAGKSQPDAETAVEQDGYNTAEEGSASAIASNGTTPTTPGGSSSNPIDEVASQAESAETAEVNDANQVKNKILPDTNSLPDSVQNVLANLKDSALDLGGTLSTIVGFINPFYKIAVPLCLVYDGSLSSPDAGQTIDTQNTQLERSALWIQSASSQLKDGSTANGEAVGAFNYKLGDIGNSYAEQEASGLPVDTSNFASTEASPTGQYSIADVGLPSPLSSVVDSLGGACPTLTNIWVGAVLGGANIAVAAVVGALTGGEGDVGIAGGEGAAEAAADEAVPSLATRVLTKIVNGGSNLRDFGVQTGRSIVLIGAATLIAKEIVASKIGASHNSLATGQPYDDGVYCGTNIYANQIEQQQFYGAPMTDERLPADNANNQAQLAYQESQQSAFNRYVSPSNPNSLVADMAMSATSYVGRSTFTSLPRLSGALLNPVRAMGSMLTPLLSHTAFAATPVTSASTYCGNVQFGFTPYEKSLIDNDSTYKPLENQLYLDQSGQEANIAARYGQCFTESIGTMIANGDIQRTSDGDIVPNKGLCSPSNLGTANQDPGQGPEGHGFNDLVFRWRVAQSYNNTLDQLSQMQDVSDTSPSPSPTGPTSGTGLPTGSAQDLAKQIEPYISSGKLFCGSAAGGSGPADCLDIQNTAKGIPIGGNCAVSSLTPHLLGLILGLEQEGWKLGISAICSNHSPEGDGPYAGHSYGSAADFSIQNGATGAAAAADEKFVDDAAALLSQTGGSFGQEECRNPNYPVLNNPKFTNFDDTCNHQHIRAAP